MKKFAEEYSAVYHGETEFQNELKERAENRKIVKTVFGDINFRHLEDEVEVPLTSMALIVGGMNTDYTTLFGDRADATSEAFLKGSSLYAELNGENIPLRKCSLDALLTIFKAGAGTLDLAPEKQASHFNDFAELRSRRTALVIEQDDMINTIRTGVYKFVPLEDMFNETNKFVEKEFPQAKFVLGMYTHPYTYWTYSFGAYQEDLQKALRGTPFEDFSPALRISTSVIGEGAMQISPILVKGTFAVPMNAPIKIVHKGDDLLKLFRAGLKTAQARFADAEKAFTALDNTIVTNPVNAIRRICSEMKFPKKYMIREIESFKNQNGDMPCTALECYDVLCNAYFEYCNSEKNIMAKFRFDDLLCRSLQADWTRFDLPGEYAY